MRQVRFVVTGQNSGEICDGPSIQVSRRYIVFRGFARQLKLKLPLLKMSLAFYGCRVHIYLLSAQV